MKNRILSAALAFTALASAQGAAAQNACVEPEDLSDTVIYAMPMLYEAVQAPCSSIFAASPFMVNDADAFVDRFRTGQDAAWPGTLRLLKVFMARNAAEESDDTSAMTDAFALLPEDALRPLVDVIVTQLISERLVKDIKVSTCGDVAEAMELIAPLPPENVAGLAAFIGKQADLDNPAICGAKPIAAE